MREEDEELESLSVRTSDTCFERRWRSRVSERGLGKSSKDGSLCRKVGVCTSLW